MHFCSLLSPWNEISMGKRALLLGRSECRKQLSSAACQWEPVLYVEQRESPPAADGGNLFWHGGGLKFLIRRHRLNWLTLLGLFLTAHVVADVNSPGGIGAAAWIVHSKLLKPGCQESHCRIILRSSPDIGYVKRKTRGVYYTLALSSLSHAVFMSYRECFSFK